MSETVESPSDRAADARAELERERAVLQERVTELDSSGHELDFDENFADSAQVAAEMGENRVLFDQLRRELDDVEHALTRLDDGTYGTCETCGEPIGDDRLELLPATRFCINCA